MSMTSKVNPALRAAIITYLGARPGQNVTNQTLYFGLPTFYSRRSIQEATQKLTKDGTLVLTSRGRYQLTVKLPTAVAASQGV